MQVTGSLKYDVQIAASVREEGAALRRDFGNGRPVWMAASTRPGEEALVLEIFRQARRQEPELLLVLAPRHPERFAEVERLCLGAGLRVWRRTAGSAADRGMDVFLLDTMGELPRFYAAADVAFVGGSLLPYGGQNMLEPAALGIPVVVGPHLFNFEAIAERLGAGGALRVGRTPDEVLEALLAWLRDSELRDAAGRAGRAIIEANRGATGRTLVLLAPLLQAQDASVSR